MTFETRYTIQRLTPSYCTEWLMNADQWSDEAEDAEEFRTSGKAQRRADRVGGEVFSHSRPATPLEAAMMGAPVHTVSRRRAA
ncbi:MAG TPA: hypothetical protein VGO22_03130 [Pseudorhizobium sp.]|jgi:hypothetical protein|nr:hypothetical protein [Pseudorhizobium sp.]